MVIQFAQYSVLLIIGADWLFSPDNVDCESSNILYLATCRLCPDNLQYAGAARDIKLQISNIQVRLLLLHVVVVVVVWW